MSTSNISLTHLVREPRERTGGRPPLLLLLHGFGSNEADLLGLAPSLDGRPLVVSARAPVVLGPGSYAWFSLDLTPEGMVADLAQAKRSLEMLPGFIDELVEAYGTEAGATYLAGFSQGAMMSLALMLTRPEKVAGVAAMSGRLPAPLPAGGADRAALEGMPVIVTHGLYDPLLPVEGARAARRYLEGLPVRLTYREYPMAHEVSLESLRDVAAWLKAALDARDAAGGGRGQE
jgi:phospholipase/carboxylesterase